MARILTLVGALFAIVLLAFSAPFSAFAQPPGGTYKVIGKDKFQEELDQAVAAGYRLVAGDAGARVAILERTNETVRRSYLYVRIVDKFLKEGKLPTGYRLLPFSFGGDGYILHALFEKVDGDDKARGYRVVSKRSAGGLREHFEQGGEGSSGVIAIAAMPGAAAIYESRPDASKAVIVASGNSGTLQQELGNAGERGLCITDSDGIKEALYVLQDCSVPGARKYEVIATTSTETFEKELNAAAARGMRLVPTSLVGIEKRVLGNAYNNETVGVVEQVGDAAPVTYRALGVSRVPTLAKELDDAANAGFRFVAFGIGPKELVAVLEKR